MTPGPQEIITIGSYRIYPAWFQGHPSEPMQELARHAARQLNLEVAGIVIIAEDNNDWGHYIDFDVLYASANLLNGSSS